MNWGFLPGYSFEGKMLGHLVQGVRTIDRLAGELGYAAGKSCYAGAYDPVSSLRAGIRKS